MKWKRYWVNEAGVITHADSSGVGMVFYFEPTLRPQNAHTVTPTLLNNFLLLYFIICLDSFYRFGKNNWPHHQLANNFTTFPRPTKWYSHWKFQTRIIYCRKLIYNEYLNYEIQRRFLEITWSEMLCYALKLLSAIVT